MVFLDQLITILFWLLVFLLPTQLAYHFWPKFAYIYGIRIDYLAPTIYLTDLLLLLIFGLSFLKARKLHFSLAGFSGWKILPFVLVIGFSLLNALTAGSAPTAFYKWVKIGEFGLLIYLVAGSEFFKNNKWLIPLSLSAIFFALIGAAQFSLGKTLADFFWFLGEREFNLGTPGISLVNLFGKDFLRPYSTFPHPNALSGYFLITAVLVANVYPKTKVKFQKYLFGATFAFSLIAVGISFSLAGYLGVLLFVLMAFQKRFNFFAIVLKILFLFIIIFSLTLPIFSSSVLSKGFWPEQSFYNRLVLAKEAGGFFSEAPLFGIGAGNFLVNLSGSSFPGRDFQLLQPVHNIFLLVLSEFGLVGLISFCYLLFLSLGKTLVKRRWEMAIALTLIVFTGFFDHYWVTLQQNQLLFSLILGLSLRNRTV